MREILIIHNTFGDPADPLYPSRAAVMDQVQAVLDSCHQLGLSATVAAIEDLRHLTDVLAQRSERVIFNLAEEFVGNIRAACYVPAVCNAFGKSCTGNDTPALLMAQNKIQTKAVLLGSGLPAAQAKVIYLDQKPDLSDLPAGRYIIKPAFNDASEGITLDSVVWLPQETARAAQRIAMLHSQFCQPVLVEQYIDGKELNISVYQDGDQVRVLTLAEIDFSAFPPDMPRIVDYNAKWIPDSFTFENTPRRIPADVPPTVAEQIRRLAGWAWRVLGCRDYARVDFRLDPQFNPYIIEVNPNPDITPEGGFAAALQASNIPYAQFVATMVSNALKRLENVLIC